jgi:aromatic-L-amino-acid/L-tryptophan decarboxylase
LVGGTTDGLERVRTLARARTVEPQEVIVEQWSLDREFYVVLEGIAAVIRDGNEVDEIGRGEFFGEFAALEWGGSFAYSRLATVSARTPMQLAVLSAEALT